MVLPSPAVRVSAVYAAIFVTFGIHLPFFPVLLAHRGLSEAEIAVMVAVPTIVRVSTSPLIGLLSDRAASRRRITAFYAAGAAAAFATFGIADGFLAMVLVMSLTSMLWNGVLPGTDTIAIGLGRSGADYGRMRLWGSISFMATSAGAGVLLGETGPGAIYHLLAAAFVIQAVSVLGLPETPRPTTAAVKDPPPRFRDVLADRGLVVVLAGSALIQGSHAMAYGFQSLHWTGIGFEKWLIGAFWTVAVTAEIVLFATAGRFAGRIGPVPLLLIGGAGAVVRWAIYPFLGASVLAWGLVQVLHALSFAAVHIATMQYIGRHASDRLAGSTQGLMVMASGLTMAGATLASGPLYARFGVDAFPAMSLLAAAGMALIALRSGRAQPQRAGAGG